MVAPEGKLIENMNASSTCYCHTDVWINQYSVG